MACMTVDTLSQGEKAKIIGIQEIDHAHRQRLLAMGLVPGAVFTLLRYAPLGDPLILRVGQSCLVLRRREASCLNIEVLT